MSAGSNLRPRLALRFGITGHRPPRLQPEHHEVARKACIEIFREAASALKDIHSEFPSVFSHDDPAVRLVTALASGADTVAAQAALSEGIALSACLPFPPEIYARDFSEDEWAQAAEMMDAADGTLAITDYPGSDEAAYEAVGRLVLAQSDILIAIWDGEPARGRGGTTEVVAEAVSRHIPVIHINPDGRHEPILLWSGLHDEIPDRPTIDGIMRVPVKDALPSLISALCSPPEDEEYQSLQDFLAGIAFINKRGFEWPILLFLTGAKSWKQTSFASPGPSQSRSYLEPLIAPFSGLGRFGHRLAGPLAERFGRADAAASASALQFRSSFVTNFALSAVAVMLALSSLLVPGAKVWLITAELLVIASIIGNTRRANRRNYHQLWIDRRHLAERLRLLAISSTLGRLSLRDVEDGTTHPGWETWYARATARELELPQGNLDQRYLAKVRDAVLSLIDDQIAYHHKNAHLMEHANHRLHKAGDALFVGTILFCLLYFAGKMFPALYVDFNGIGLTQIVTVATALFPALAASLYGIRMQGDFAATAERSAAIERRLGKLRSSMLADTLTYTRLVDRIRRLSEVMLSDIHQWQQQYETRPLSLPG